MILSLNPSRVNLSIFLARNKGFSAYLCVVVDSIIICLSTRPSNSNNLISNRSNSNPKGTKSNTFTGDSLCSPVELLCIFHFCNQNQNFFLFLF